MIRSARSNKPLAARYTPCAAGCFLPKLGHGMDLGLENVIRQALADAQAAGKDYLGQTEHAVRAVQQVRSDMTASDALATVNMVQQS